MSPLSELGEAALTQARQGTPVFPVRERGKEPLTAHGFKDAVTDEAQIREWWTRWPNANIATPTGIKYDVIDLDSPAARDALAEHLDTLPIIGRAKSPRDGGGEHLYVPPTGLGNLPTKQHYASVDYRGDGGYVLVPPSVGANGRKYEWIEVLKPAAGRVEPSHPFYAPFMPGGTIEMPAVTSYTNPRLAELVQNGIPAGVQDETLRDVVWNLRRDGITEDVAAGVWWAIVGNSPQTAEPWTVRDFERHWGGANEKISRGEQSGPDGDPWAFQDFSDVIRGEYVRTVPEILPRSDGHKLFYRGKIHWLQGESESGKSWIALLAAKDDMLAGNDVLYLDYESDRGEVIGRLLALQAPPDLLTQRFRYIQAHARPDGATFEALLTYGFRTVVVDGVTEATSTMELSGRDENEVATFVAAIARRFEAAGASVIHIDHIAKNDGSGKNPLGSQHKRSAVTGCSYVVEAGSAGGPVRGRVGYIRLRVAKDRPSYIRAISGKPWADGTQVTATVQFDARDPERIVCDIQPPDKGDDSDPHEPTGCMRAIARWLEQNPGSSQRAILGADIGGYKTETRKRALALLIEKGHVKVEDGPKNSKLHTLVTMYYEPVTEPSPPVVISVVTDSDSSEDDECPF